MKAEIVQFVHIFFVTEIRDFHEQNREDGARPAPQLVGSLSQDNFFNRVSTNR